MSDLDDLTQIGAADDAIRAEQRAVARARQRLADADAAVAAIEAHLAAILTEQQELRAREAELENRLARYGKQLDAALKSLETGLGDPEVSERQRVACVGLIDEVETGILECIEEQEQAQERHRATSKELDQTSESTEATRQDVEREIAERSTRVHGLRAERQPLVDGLYKDIRERYDILLQRKGSAVAALDGDQNRRRRGRTVEKRDRRHSRGPICPCNGVEEGST